MPVSDAFIILAIAMEEDAFCGNPTEQNYLPGISPAKVSLIRSD